jgi:hypothetical protein
MGFAEESPSKKIQIVTAEIENRKLNDLKVCYWVIFLKKLFVSINSDELLCTGLQQTLLQNTIKPKNLL